MGMAMVGVSMALPTAAAPAFSTPRRDKRPISVSDVSIALPPSLLVEPSDALGRPFLGIATNRCSKRSTMARDPSQKLREG